MSSLTQLKQPIGMSKLALIILLEILLYPHKLPINGLLSLHLAWKDTASTADARFLEQRLATLKERLEESERELVLYGSDTGIVTLDQIRDPNGRAIANRTLTGATLEQLARELNTAITAYCGGSA